MRFEVQDVAVECVRVLRGMTDRLRLRDADLADQLRRAANSMALNIAEGRWRTGKDKSNRFRVAAGSANEVRACLNVAEAWGMLSAEETREPIALIDRLLAMLWRLLHPRNRNPNRLRSTESTPTADHGH